ncbi:MAG: hypothetical protein UT30_C0017G0012 [Candidatus Uhrbacteria bacterium GW2011_GWF2_39_13]|uniref:Uncharacterized protein n=1 Tax=Candidatus Uhrbacteria bacterium GW2011_GWF2_39_13 TaxID=1618995 RepID=A0A0G0ML39_9BACT|nr:MAG: hypothetical protein UT30_C0017G0012 [Candidatus Uhrbacteria bacterium GW2011_GWF2_39_13]
MGATDFFCHSCTCGSFKLNGNGTVREMKDILPENICPLLFHSVYAYILTLVNGGWMNWVGHETHVIVNCPYTNGVAVYVKGNNVPHTIEIELIKTGVCPKAYKLGQAFIFSTRPENMLLMSMIEKAFPDILIFSEENKCQSKTYLHNFDNREISFEIEYTGR